ncbi:conserved hypothetical protein [Ricinus communis]|uniref:Uncharacterized protein n=1 Tax=Ricinus communis TaxID=3988 RepID=B9SLF6_RICCO|nr:conserved hypothetical protein [Ricinus communis]
MDIERVSLGVWSARRKGEGDLRFCWVSDERGKRTVGDGVTVVGMVAGVHLMFERVER